MLPNKRCLHQTANLIGYGYVADEIMEDGTTAQKIYDIDLNCRTAKEYYQEICQYGCDLVADRNF